jgi:serine/threonine protein phosphatase PrpC
MRFTIFQDSRLGDRRDNEDRVGYAYGRDRLLMVVADGMGGHLYGELAAQIAVSETMRLFEREAGPRLEHPAQFLVALLQAAHRAIVACAADLALAESPRTTCVACVVQEGKAWWAHAGDSRLYLLRGGRLHAATKDHSRVQQMIDAGLLTPEAAAAHPERNKVYSCIGGDLPPTIDSGGGIALAAGDHLILSSDGFWGQVPVATLIAKLQKKPLLAALPDLLTDAQLLARGYSDNLSVVAMTWETQDESRPAAPAPERRRFTSVGDTTWPGGPGRPAGISDREFDEALAVIREALRKTQR